MHPHPTMTPVIEADEETRAGFLVKVYQHMALALAAFLVFETLLFTSGIAERIWNFVAGGGPRWLLILGGFMLVNVIVDRSATKIGNPTAQYGALFGLAAAQALIFAPFLFMIFRQDGAGTVASAAVVTVVGFALLTVVAMTTRKDLSFLRPLIMWGGIAALGLIVVAVFTGMQLGALFSVAMIGLAGASILYQTQSIVRRYPEWAYVAAAVGLFGSFMTLFWYVLRLFVSRD